MEDEMKKLFTEVGRKTGWRRAPQRFLFPHSIDFRIITINRIMDRFQISQLLYPIKTFLRDNFSECKHDNTICDNLEIAVLKLSSRIFEMNPTAQNLFITVYKGFWYNDTWIDINIRFTV